MNTQSSVKDSTDQKNRKHGLKSSGEGGKKTHKAPESRKQETEITKAYEFICVVSVKPMCCRAKFPKPHIYQGSIDCEPLFESFIRNDHPNVFLAFARIANDYLTTHSTYLIRAIHAISPNVLSAAIARSSTPELHSIRFVCDGRSAKRAEKNNSESLCNGHIWKRE